MFGNAVPIAAALMAVFMVAVPAPVHANPRAATLLAQFPFSDGERKRIMAGELVTTASREKTSDRELAITMAFLISKSPADLVERFGKASDYGTDKSATAHGELRGAGSLADLQRLRLEPNGDAEARRFADAKAGDELNLSSTEITALRSATRQEQGRGRGRAA